MRKTAIKAVNQTVKEHMYCTDSSYKTSYFEIQLQRSTSIYVLSIVTLLRSTLDPEHVLESELKPFTRYHVLHYIKSSIVNLIIKKVLSASVDE